jgi:hypothetical protein
MTTGFGARKLLVAGERDVILSDPNLTSFATVTNAVDVNQATVNRLGVTAEMAYWNSTAFSLEGARTPRIFTGQTSGNTGAGSFTIWTPTGGTRFRLMAYLLGFTANAAAAAAGVVLMALSDGGTIINATRFRMFVPAASAVTVPADVTSGWIVLPGNGYLSTAVNALLRLETGTALTAGEYWAIALGTEE